MTTPGEGPLAHDWLDEALPPNVAFGEGTWIYSAFAFLHYRSRQPVGLRVADHTGIYLGSFFELGPEGQVEIGRYCSIVGAVIASNGRVSIGNHCLISHEVVIADTAFVRPPGDRMRRVNSGPSLGDDVWVGMGAAILGPVSIGDGSVVAARAVVARDIPPYSVAAGNPAVVVRRMEPPTAAAR